VNKTIKLLATFLFPLFLSAQMSGVYTIGPLGGDNFTSFNEAVDSLTALGVNGPVIINARAGIYNEKVSIPYISGVSATNTILFQSLLLNRALVTLTDTPSLIKNYIVQLNGADYISFNEMSIIVRTKNNIPAYTGVIRIENGAHHNKFINNNIISKQFASFASSPADFNRITIFSPATKDTHNVIVDNTIIGGIHGVLFEGSGSLANELERDNIIVGNELENQSTTGIFSSFQEEIKIVGNLVLSNSSKSNYVAITSFKNYTSTYIAYNIVANASSGIGINVDSTFATDSTSSLVENNFVQIGESPLPAVAIYTHSSKFLTVRNNNTNITTNNPISAALAIDSFCDKVIIINNNLINTTGGLCLAIDSLNRIDTTDYNNIWNNGGPVLVLAENGTNSSNSIPVWQTASSMATNSVSVDPFYFSFFDLHICQPLLDSIGLSTDLASDIDFQTRNISNPDIGADEIFIQNNDIGIIDVNLNPIKSYSCNVDSLFVIVKNQGKNTITNYTVQWIVNGVLQTPVNVSNSIGPCENDTIILGPIALNYGLYNADFWTELTGDPNPFNDSFYVRNALVRKPLNGTYTVGGVAPDFINFTDAKRYIEQYGICGSVIFNVRDGIYVEKVNINPIEGSSVINTITFQSENLDSNLVTLTASPNSLSGNHVLRLNGASHFIFKNITFSTNLASVAPPMGRVIVIDSNSSDIKILNNRIMSNALGSVPPTPENWANIFTDTLQNDSILVRNNIIVDGAMGIYLKGVDSTLFEINTNILGNIIEGQVYMGIQLDGQKNPTVNYNTITLNPQIAGEYGILLNFIRNGFSISFNRNRIANVKAGIRVNNSFLSVSGNSLISNNFVAVGTAAFPSTNHGIQLNNTSSIDVYNNNVNNISSDTISASFIEQASKNINLLNNVLASTGGGRSIVLGSVSSLDTSDYNDLWNNASGTALVDFSRTLANNIAAWRALYVMDNNSTSVNPFFNTPLGSDLHVCSDSLSNKGLPLTSISTDIDGQIRNPLTPDIGADEFDSVSADLGLNATMLCPLDPLVLTAQTPGMLYQWSSGQTTRSISIISPTGLGTNTIDTISVIAYNACDTAWDTAYITYNTGLPFTLGNDTSLCFDDSLTLSVVSVAPISSYIWSTGNSTSSIIVTQPGGIYSVSISDGNCSNNDSINVTFIGPNTNLGNDTFLCSGSSLILDAGAGSGYTYNWSTGDSTQTYTVTTIGAYAVTVSDSATGCSVSDNIIITDCPIIGVPTAFSPNGDGQNDILYVKSAGLNSLSFIIFDRWGQRVFSTSDVTVGWDGTFKGKAQEMDVYVYYLQATLADGTPIEQRGKITLLR